jgi:UDP-glucuronate 4-epimerase
MCSLKHDRLARIASHSSFHEARIDIENLEAMQRVVSEFRPQRVVNLAAQAGVRYSLTNPHAYISSNIQGFMNVLELCRHHEVEHLVYASSSSVYGANTRMPFSVHDNVDHPVSLYAASKKANELMAHTYSHLYGLPTTGLRFFTVYGPWGRPDMALFIFTRKILAGEPIDVFNHGHHQRDFTYIDDIVEGVIRTLDQVAVPDPGWQRRHARCCHVEGTVPALQHRQQQPGRTAALYRHPRAMPRPQGTEKPAATAAGRRAEHVRRCRRADAGHVGYKPSTPVEEGIARFVKWYRDYYGV